MLDNHEYDKNKAHKIPTGFRLINFPTLGLCSSLNKNRINITEKHSMIHHKNDTINIFQLTKFSHT